MSGSEEIESALLAVEAIEKSSCVLDAFKEQITSLKSAMLGVRGVVPRMIFGGNQSTGKTSTIRWLTAQEEEKSILCSGDGAVTRFVTEFNFSPDHDATKYEVLYPEAGGATFRSIEREEIDQWKKEFDKFMDAMNGFYGGSVALRIHMPCDLRLSITDNPGLQFKERDWMLNAIYNPQLQQESSILVSVIKASSDPFTDSYLGVMREDPDRRSALARGMVILTHIDHATPQLMKMWYEELTKDGCQHIFISSERVSEAEIAEIVKGLGHKFVCSHEEILAQITKRLGDEMKANGKMILEKLAPLGDSLDQLSRAMLGAGAGYDPIEAATLHTQQIMNLSQALRSWLEEFRGEIANIIKCPTRPNEAPSADLNVQFKFPPAEDTRKRLVDGKIDEVTAHFHAALDAVHGTIATKLAQEFRNKAPLISSYYIKETVRENALRVLRENIQRVKDEDLPSLNLSPESITLSRAESLECNLMWDMFDAMKGKEQRNLYTARAAYHVAIKRYYMRMFNSALSSIEAIVEQKIAGIVVCIADIIGNSICDQSIMSQFSSENQMSADVRKHVATIRNFVESLRAQHA